ncbi:serine-rich adhesin for platelets-like isoform X2 [Narcine bancroftii]|uniref:serine-rich adhesin for platelets-like isoform X2 n=1 Tax=Narcine bancroftii TaxID=1343680 RepID=UPI00383220DF
MYRKFTKKKLFEHSEFRDDIEESRPNRGMEPLQDAHQKTIYKPLVEGFQDISSGQMKATTNRYKKIKKNRKVTFLKCPQRKTIKGVKRHEINEPTLTENWKDRNISYCDLPIAPPLPKELFRNYSEALEQSVPNQILSPTSNILGLLASKTNTMNTTNTEQHGSLYPNRYWCTNQRSKKGASGETPPPILIHINSHHSHFTVCEHKITNLSLGLTSDRPKNCTSGSISSPQWPSDINANTVTLASDDTPGATSDPAHSLSTQVGRNEQDAFNYSKHSEVTSAGSLPAMLTSSVGTMLSQNYNDVTPAADKGKGISKPSLWPQVSCEEVKTKDNGMHNVSVLQKPKKLPITRFFHLTDRRSSSLIRSRSVNHTAVQPEREGEIKMINHKSYSPTLGVTESVKYPKCFDESFLQDSVKPVTLSSLIQPSSSQMSGYVQGASSHIIRSQDSLHKDNEQTRCYSHFKSANLNSEEDTTSSVQNYTQHQRPTKIPITRIFQVTHKRSHSYSESLASHQEADSQSSARRARSISPQKSCNSLGSREKMHFIPPYCYKETLMDKNKHSSHGYVADDAHLPSQSSTQPLYTDIDNAQSISNSSINDQQNANDGLISLTGSVPCGAEGKRQSKLECLSSSATLPYMNSHTPQTSRSFHCSQSPHLTAHTRNEPEFSVHSPWPHMGTSTTRCSPIRLLLAGMHEAPSQSLPTCTDITERLSHCPEQTPSSHPSAKAHVPYSITQSQSIHFHNNIQNTPGFPTGDNKTQQLFCASNQPLTTDVGHNVLHDPLQSLVTNFMDKEIEYVNRNENAQHPSTHSLTSNINNTHARPSVSSHFINDVWNTHTYSSDHVKYNVQTASNSSSNLLLNIVNEHTPVFPSNTPFNLDVGFPATPNLLMQPQFTHEDHLFNSSSSSSQSLHLNTDNVSYPSTQMTSSQIVDNKQGRSGHPVRVSNSSTSQIDGNNQNASDLVFHLLDPNDEHHSSHCLSCASLPCVDVSGGAAQMPPSTSPPNELGVRPPASCSQVQSNNVDDTVQGISYALSQLMSTDLDENNQDIPQTFIPPISSIHSHSSLMEGQKISTSSRHLQSAHVKDNTIEDFRSSPKPLNNYIDENSTSKASTPSAYVQDNVHWICSSAISSLLLTHDRGQGARSSPAQSTFVSHCAQSTSHSAGQMPSPYFSEIRQDVSPSCAQVCTSDKQVRDLCSPSSLHNESKGVSHASPQIFPHGQCTLHDVKPVNSPSSHSAVSCSIHSLFSSRGTSQFVLPPESLIYFNNDQQVVSNCFTHSKHTNKTNYEQDASYSTSQLSVTPVHNNTSVTPKESMQSLITCTDPNQINGSNSSTPPLSSPIDNNFHCLSNTHKWIVDGDIPEVAASFIPFTPEVCEHVAEPATTSQINHVHTNDPNTHSLFDEPGASILRPTPSVTCKVGQTSHLPAHSVLSKAEKSEKDASCSSIHSLCISVYHSEKPICSPAPLLSETEEVTQVVSDSSNHSHIIRAPSSCPAENEQAAASSNPAIKNVQGSFQSFTSINDKEDFRTFIQSPQVINERTLHTAKLLSPTANNTQMTFCSSTQSRATHANTCAQDASFYFHSLSSSVDDNVQSLSPPSQMLENTGNAKDESSSNWSQMSPVSDKLQTVSYSPTHSNTACNNQKGDSNTHIQSRPICDHLRCGSKSPKQSNLASDNLQGGSKSLMQANDCMTGNNVQGDPETCTQPQFNLDDNNQQDGSTSPAQSSCISVSKKPHEISCSYTDSLFQPLCNNPKVAPCSLTQIDDESDKLGAFRLSRHSQSPHAFHRIKPVSFSAQALTSPISDHGLAETQDSLKSSNYMDEDQQVVSDLFTHRAGNVPMKNHIDDSLQNPVYSSQSDKVEGLHYSYKHPHSTNSYNNPNKCESFNQSQSNYVTKIMPPAACSSISCKYPTDLGSNFLSPAPSSSVFPSSTSQDDSSGAWSSSNHSMLAVSCDSLSSVSSSLMLSSPRTDDATSYISGFSVSTLYDDYDDILTAS